MNEWGYEKLLEIMTSSSASFLQIEHDVIAFPDSYASILQKANSDS